MFTGRSISNHTRLLLLSFSRLVEKKKSQKKKKRSWWLDCRHGSVFEAAHRAHFINGAGRVVDAFVCRLNVAADWPRSYKRGAWLATGRSGTVAPSEGDPCSRPPMFPRLSLSLSPPPVVFRLSTPLLSSSLSPLLRSSIGWSPGVIREQWHFTVFLHLSLFPSAHSFFQVYIELDITIFVDSIYQRRELIWDFVEMNVFSMSRKRKRFSPRFSAENSRGYSSGDSSL